MSKPDAPTPPDYTGAAYAQGDANINAGITGAALGSPDQDNPFGTTSWSNPEYDAALAAWNARNPGQPKAADASGGSDPFDPSMSDYTLFGGDAGGVPVDAAGQALLGPLGLTLPGGSLNAKIGDNFNLPTPGHVLGKDGDEGSAPAAPPDPYQTWLGEKPDIADYSKPGSYKMKTAFSPQLQALFNKAAGGVDFSGLPELQGGTEEERRRIEDAMYARATRFLDPQRSGYESTLADRGVMPGQEQYNSSLGKFDEQYGDARDRAILMGGNEMSRIFDQSYKARGQGLQELLTGRALPLDEMARLKGLMPSGSMNALNIAPPDLMGAVNSQYGAANNQYGIESAQAGSQTAAGATALAAIIAAICDPALKQDVKELPAGIMDKLAQVPIREFSYRPEVGLEGMRFIGPMADDWARQFGGDSHKIHLLSMLGVMMKGMQEMRQEIAALRQQVEAGYGR